MRRACIIASVCLFVLTTLGACSSVPDLTFSDGDAAGNPDGPGSEGSPFVEGGSGDGADAADAADDGPIPGCIPQPEICDDGIDNDCDRHTDCDDPDCKPGFACVPAAPSGWQLVGFSAATQPA